VKGGKKMSIIRITKKDVQKASRARNAALKKDAEFRAFEAEEEKQVKKTIKPRRKGGKK